MKFQEGGGLLEVAFFFLTAIGLDFAKCVECFLELAGEPLAVQAESGQHRGWGLGVGDWGLAVGGWR